MWKWRQCKCWWNSITQNPELLPEIPSNDLYDMAVGRLVIFALFQFPHLFSNYIKDRSEQAALTVTDAAQAYWPAVSWVVVLRTGAVNIAVIVHGFCSAAGTSSTHYSCTLSRWLSSCWLSIELSVFRLLSKTLFCHFHVSILQHKQP